MGFVPSPLFAHMIFNANIRGENAEADGGMVCIG